MSSFRLRKGGVGAIDNFGHDRQEIGRLIILVGRMLRQDFDRQVGGAGVTRSQWSMIAVVSRMPGATQRKIAEILEISEASAGRLIDRLCADGLLERTQHGSDRRARAVRLTDKATPMLEQLVSFARANEERIFRGFSDEELSGFFRLLEKLRNNLGP